MPAYASSAARGTLLSIALRLTSFLLSQLTIRSVSAAALGKASIPLELLLSTSLFIGREGFRLALTKEIGDDGCLKRTNEQQKNKDQQLINVSWLSIPVGAIVSSFALLIHLRKCSTNSMDSDQDTQGDYSQWDYKLAGIMYCLASFIESLSEPLVIRCLQTMDFTLKAKAEGAALVMKSLSCFICLNCTHYDWYVNVIMKMGNYSVSNDDESSKPHFAVAAFGISQLVYALVFTTIMYRSAMTSLGGVYLPQNIKALKRNPYQVGNDDRALAYPTKISIFHGHTLYLICIFTLQG